jgi:preprotein translocase subunit SecE
MASQETAIQTSPSRWKKFLREVKAELRKVSWPNRQELTSYTGIVFISVVMIAVLIWIMDAAFSEVLRRIINK